jgi:hypothetical protein
VTLSIGCKLFEVLPIAMKYQLSPTQPVMQMFFFKRRTYVDVAFIVEPILIRLFYTHKSFFSLTMILLVYQDDSKIHNWQSNVSRQVRQ